MDAPTIFISYSHKDREWLDELLTMLRPLAYSETIELWADTRVKPGQAWREEIRNSLLRARVAVLLVSKDYLASDFILQVEFPLIFNRADVGALTVLWVYVGHCAYEATPIKEHQAAHCKLEPIKGLPESERESVWKEVSTAIKEAVAPSHELRPIVWAGDGVDMYFSASWPRCDPALFGREQELRWLDEAWEDPQTSIISCAAAGGVGKTALVDYWLNQHMQRQRWRGARRVFGWSFYSQGSTDGRQASADRFVREALRWFGDRELADSAQSAWDKGRRLAELVCHRRTLLVLDGVEPLQDPPSAPTAGRLKDPALQALLRSLARGHPGLCVVTTRVQIDDLKTFHGTSVRAVDLDCLCDAAGAAHLRNLGVCGSDEELMHVSREYRGHALALTLLGTYTAVALDGDIRQRDRMHGIPDEGRHTGHAERVMTWYERQLEGSPELDLLRLLGLFDRPVEPAVIDVLRAEPPIEQLTTRLIGQSQAAWKYTLHRLRAARLISESGHRPGDLVCHPLVRAHFGNRLRTQSPAAWREAHNRLYDHYQRLPLKHNPDTLDGLLPLYRAVVHGCHAGRHQEALKDVYLERISRGQEGYSVYKLGAFGVELASLNAFFDPPWDQPVVGLKEADKALVLYLVGFRLWALGRLDEAIKPMETAFSTFISQEDWEGAVAAAANVSELLLFLGNVSQSLEYAERGLHCAENTDDSRRRNACWTALGDARHQAGRIDEARIAFREGQTTVRETEVGKARVETSEDGYQWERQHGRPGGFRYCDFLLQCGQLREAKQVATESLKRAERDGGLVYIGLDNLTLGRAQLLAEHADRREDPILAENHLNQAVKWLRRAGRHDYLPRALLARADLNRQRQEFGPAGQDLDEAYEIASRGGMQLVECDVHMGCCRLILAMIDARRQFKKDELPVGTPFALYDPAVDRLAAARMHLAEAAELIRQTGYHRRDGEVEALRKQIEPD